MLPIVKPAAFLLALTFCLGVFAQSVFAQSVAVQPAEPVAAPPVQFAEDDEAVEMLTRGALHEAFADQVSQDLVLGVLAPIAPPEPIEELPPEIKPEGDDILWIPGYWYWDDQRGDYIWISGVWRKTPPGRRWVPGYWTEVDGKYRRVSGFWDRDAVSSLEYLPYPPDSLERGPSSPAPSADYFWAPGCWVYYNNGYSWRPGHWERFRSDWVWMPTRYVWSPRGCLYQSGYWDYPFASRGQLYSPVYFHNHVYQQPRFCFQPSLTISTRSIFLHLFVRSGHSHYYFGNYYDNQYHNQYYPWYDYGRVGRRYDPLITHAHGRSHLAGVDYVKRMRDWNHYFSGHADHRPPATIRQQREFEDRHQNFSRLNQVVLGRSIQQTLHDSDAYLRSHRTSTSQQDQLRRDLAKIHALAETRRHDEADALPNQHGRIGATPGHGPESSRDGRDDDARPRRDRTPLPAATPDAGGRGGAGRFNPDQIGTQRSRGSDLPGGRPGGLSSRGDANQDHDHPRPGFSHVDRIGRGRINRAADNPSPAAKAVENAAAKAAIAAAKATADRAGRSAQPSYQQPKSNSVRTMQKPRPSAPEIRPPAPELQPGVERRSKVQPSPVGPRPATSPSARPPITPTPKTTPAPRPAPAPKTTPAPRTTPAPKTTPAPRPATPSFNGRSDAREQPRASFSRPGGATAKPNSASPPRPNATPNGRPSFARPQPNAKSSSAPGPQRSFSSRGADANGRRPKRDDM